jgi:hypothetical protein
MNIVFVYVKISYILRNIAYTELPTGHCVDKSFLRDMIKGKMSWRFAMYSAQLCSVAVCAICVRILESQRGMGLRRWTAAYDFEGRHENATERDLNTGLLAS